MIHGNCDSPSYRMIYISRISKVDNLDEIGIFIQRNNGIAVSKSKISRCGLVSSRFGFVWATVWDGPVHELGWFMGWVGWTGFIIWIGRFSLRALMGWANIFQPTNYPPFSRAWIRLVIGQACTAHETGWVGWTGSYCLPPLVWSKVIYVI